MKNIGLIIITVLATWFVLTMVNIDMPFVPNIEVTSVPSELAQTTVSSSTVISVPQSAVMSYREVSLYIFKSINDVRVSYGLDELVWSEVLAGLAQEHSSWMALTSIYKHSENNVWENICTGTGYSNDIEAADAAVQSWLDSPPHRENMLNPNRSYGAIGYAKKGATFYVTFMAE